MKTTADQRIGLATILAAESTVYFIDKDVLGKRTEPILEYLLTNLDSGWDLSGDGGGDIVGIHERISVWLVLSGMTAVIPIVAITIRIISRARIVHYSRSHGRHINNEIFRATVNYFLE